MNLANKLTRDVENAVNTKLVKIAESFTTPEEVKDFIGRTSDITGVKPEQVELSPPSFRFQRLGTTSGAGVTQPLPGGKVGLVINTVPHEASLPRKILNTPSFGVQAAKNALNTVQNPKSSLNVDVQWGTKIRGPRIKALGEDLPALRSAFERGRLSADEFKKSFRGKAEELKGLKGMESGERARVWQDLSDKVAPDDLVKKYFKEPRYNPSFAEPATLFHELSHAKRSLSGTMPPRKGGPFSRMQVGPRALQEETTANIDSMKNLAKYNPMEFLNPRTTTGLLESQGSYMKGFLRPHYDPDTPIGLGDLFY